MKEWRGPFLYRVRVDGRRVGAVVLSPRAMGHTLAGTCVHRDGSREWERQRVRPQGMIRRRRIRSQYWAIDYIEPAVSWYSRYSLMSSSTARCWRSVMLVQCKQRNRWFDIQKKHDAINLGEWHLSNNWFFYSSYWEKSIHLCRSFQQHQRLWKTCCSNMTCSVFKRSTVICKFI